MIRRETYFSPVQDGWRLALHKTYDPARLNLRSRPLVLVTGFAMNASILGWHPEGPSMTTALAAAGHEVWAIDVRGHGASRAVGRRRPFTLTDVALVDVPAAIDAILSHTELPATQVDAVGCSLGATYLFMYLAWGERPKVARMINLGGPLRWVSAHPLVRMLSRLAPIYGRLPIRGTRMLARYGLPILSRVPGALNIYLHPEICDLSNPGQLTLVVEDPQPRILQQIGRWLQHGDLVLDGRNLTDDVSKLSLPLLTVVASGDGVVPEATVCSAHNVMHGAQRRIIYAGDHTRPMAHADLFISTLADQQVFQPIVHWLQETAPEHSDP